MAVLSAGSATGDEAPVEEGVVEEFRAWLAASRRDDWALLERYRLPMEERARASREWEAALGHGGWLGLTWPPEYGGRGLSMRGSALIAAELAAAGAPELFNLVGLDLVGPAIVLHGTEEQKHTFLPALLRGQIWCQGFSEPDAGSDLASLRTRADRVEGEHAGWVVNGQKVWSTYASMADYCILLARTDQNAPRHQGLSCFLMPMDTPGVERRPIRDITGDSEFFELFLNDVVLGDDTLLGQAGQGWQVAMDVLAHERNAIFSLLGTVHRDLEGAIDLVRALPDEHPARRELEDRATAAFVRESVLQSSNDRAMQHFASGAPDQRLESIMKVSWSELHQDIAQLAAEAAGTRGLVGGEDPLALEHGRWEFALLHSRAETIYAGTSEIQRNIISERVLGLPREPRG